MTAKMKQLPTPLTEKTLRGWWKNVGNGVPGTTWKKKEEKRIRGLLLYVPLITSKQSCNSKESLSGLYPTPRLSPSPTTKKTSMVGVKSLKLP
jgi:hypothetical protein